ncbi:hypothetical protein VTN00DRAFT_5039 [Thermoascus crustaceus]|uniref:uncharacterized protein n=1 Tax=Thermoascus crustaceus TaxID=5088 RepID=UPI003743BAB2
MSTRRPPLANVPNATNSPHRTGLVGAKRPRVASCQVDNQYGQPPPKKQIVDRDDAESRSPNRTKTTIYQSTESKVFSRRTTNSQPSAFEKKLVAAREKERQAQTKGSKHEKISAESLDTIRQWQKHYRKAFPQFVFYFDSIPEDVRNKCSRQVIALGAREEKFFSRLVTHVVTSRPIPPEIDPASPNDMTAASTMEQPSAEGPPQTVNPSLLEKNPEASSHLLLKSRNPFDRRPDGESRRDQSNMDVLHRARQMGMKIWALEKLQRMIATINDGDVAAHHGHYTRSHNAGVGGGRGRGEADLSQVLRNELLNGPSDRDPSASMKELVMFKGPFIYVHDMDEKTRPVMVREYPKVARRQDGAWPQFRSAPLGKCPFIDEPPSKKDIDRERARLQAKEKKTVAKPRPNTQNEAKNVDPPEQTTEKRALQDVDGGLNQRANQEEAMSAPKQTEQTDPQKVLPVWPVSPRKSSESFAPPTLSRTGPFHLGREPAASGVQPSNITSAIRSQMISSTAAAPGAKAGVSKEVHELKRKVLEKSNGGVSAGAMPSSHRTTEAAGTLKAAKAPSTRSNKTKAQDKLANINEEDTTQSEDDGANKQREASRKAAAQKKSKERKREPKPGYCENCRDKFDDFEEHIMTRKHRKFATTMSNWAELDALLYQLERPLKPEYDYV